MENSKCKVNIFHNNLEMQLFCDRNSVLMDVLHENNIYIDAPCGGNGLCGKCKVRIQGGEVSSPDQDELRFLTDKEKEHGYRLACITRVLGDIDVYISEDSGAQIMSSGGGFNIEISPSIHKKFLKLEEPNIHDQRDDFRRILDGLNMENADISLNLLKKMPEIIRNSGYALTIVYDDKKIYSLEHGDTTQDFYGIGIDIGTTTLVTYLVNLNTGDQIDVASQLNSQKPFGGDVISRIDYTIQNANGLKHLNENIINQINSMIKQLAIKNNISMDSIYNIVLVGNTTIMHFIAGITPKNIAASPFIPVCTSTMVFDADKLGLDINNHCIATLLGSISGYVGADIVGATLASRIIEQDKLNLLIDIGTNGEIVLGNRDGMVCCSTAAGPAFEGAHIKHGVGGVKGAINTVTLDNGKIKYTTIMDGKPIGICGSGIVDIVSLLIKIGLIDDTGRMIDEDEIESSEAEGLIYHMAYVGGAPAFRLANGMETANGEDIVITQKDIREIQLGKAAIAAGINTLIKTMGKKVEDIDTVYLAGGFGSYIDKKSAVGIGLLPKQLEDRIVVLGNAAGTGAIMSLLSKDSLYSCENIKNMIKYIELSSTPEFQDEYVNCMYFEG